MSIYDSSWKTILSCNTSFNKYCQGYKRDPICIGEIARDILFPIHFLSSWLAEKISTHQTTTSPIKLVGMTKYVGEGLTKKFNESQANDLLKNLKRIISPASFLVANLLSCMMKEIYRSSRVTTLCVFDPTIWLCVMMILILLSSIFLIDSVDNWILPTYSLWLWKENWDSNFGRCISTLA